MACWILAVKYFKLQPFSLSISCLFLFLILVCYFTTESILPLPPIYELKITIFLLLKKSRLNCFPYLNDYPIVAKQLRDIP